MPGSTRNPTSRSSSECSVADGPDAGPGRRGGGSGPESTPDRRDCVRSWDRRRRHLLRRSALPGCRVAAHRNRSPDVRPTSQPGPPDRRHVALSRACRRWLRSRASSGALPGGLEVARRSRIRPADPARRHLALVDDLVERRQMEAEVASCARWTPSHSSPVAFGGTQSKTDLSLSACFRAMVPVVAEPAEIPALVSETSHQPGAARPRSQPAPGRHGLPAAPASRSPAGATGARKERWLSR